MIQGIIEKLYSRFIDVIYAHRRAVLTREEVTALADGRILTGSEALEAKLVDGVAYLDETIAGLKRDLKLDKARVVTYGRAGTFKSNIYTDLPEMPLAGLRGMNSVPFNFDELSFFPGFHFLYLWNP
jgi:protease IV